MLCQSNIELAAKTVGYRGQPGLLEYLTVETAPEAILLKICRRYSTLETLRSRISRESMPPNTPKRLGIPEVGSTPCGGPIFVYAGIWLTQVLSKVVLMWWILCSAQSEWVTQVGQTVTLSPFGAYASSVRVQKVFLTVLSNLKLFN